MDKKVAFHPLVSIVIPVYNGSNFVKEAIDSALAQTYNNVEILVVNDGSTDNTEEIVKTYGDKLRYFYKENGGVATALNLGIKEARGEYISWLSHDDLYYPDKVEKQIEFLKARKNKNVVVFGSYSLLFSSTKKIVSKKISTRVRKNIRCLLGIDLENTLNGCTLLMPKKVIVNAGLFDIKLKYTQDYDLWFRLTKNVEFLYLDEYLLYSRQHDDQGGKKNPLEATIESDQLHSNIIKDLSSEEVDHYCNGSVFFLFDIYKTYKNARYVKTSFRLLNHLNRITKTKNDKELLVKTLNEVVFNYDDETLTNNILRDNKNIFIKKEKPRILIYSNVWARGGIERVMSTVMIYLKKYYEVILVTTDLEIGGSFKLTNDIVHLKISKDNQESIADRLACLCVLLDVDLFIGNPNFLINLLDVYELLLKLKIKSIACNHSYYFLPCWSPWLYPVFKKRIEAYKFADVSMWLTRFSANAYSLQNCNGVYMPNPNTFDNTSEDKLKKKKEKIILLVGRFCDSIKRLDRALIVFKKVLLTHPNSKLVIVGSYNLSMFVPNMYNVTIDNLLKSLDIPQKSISFVGEQKNVKKFYKTASLLMLTSDNEGFPMVLNEAGSFGLPCVIFEIPGLEDIISDGENGFIVPQNDCTMMADKINLLLSNDDLRLEMSGKARELTLRFDKKIVCNRWLELIELVLSTISKEGLNKILKHKYLDKIVDRRKFMMTLAREYEQQINLITNVNSNNEEGIKVPEAQKLRGSYRDYLKTFYVFIKKYEKVVLDKIYLYPIIGHLIVRIYLRVKKILMWFK